MSHRSLLSTRPTSLPLGLLLVALLLPGCGDGRPRTIAVRGRVTHDGKPLEAGTITFQPAQTPEGIPRRPAVGQIQPDGTYVVSTFEKGDGALPGEYRVAITSYVGEPPIEVLEESPPPRPSRIPLKYTSPATSGLKVTIPPDARGPVTRDFDVK